MLFNIALESVVWGLNNTDIMIRQLNTNFKLLAYTDDTMLIDKTEDEIKTLAELESNKMERGN